MLNLDGIRLEFTERCETVITKVAIITTDYPRWSLSCVASHYRVWSITAQQGPGLRQPEHLIKDLKSSPECGVKSIRNVPVCGVGAGNVG